MPFFISLCHYSFDTSHFAAAIAMIVLRLMRATHTLFEERSTPMLFTPLPEFDAAYGAAQRFA